MNIPNASPALYNEDLAPATERKWGVFSIFNVWTSDVHSLWGYYLAASLFLLCGSFVNFLIAIGLSSLVIFFLMNLVGYAGVKTGVPYPVLARASFGIWGANVPALVRAIVACFWYGAQTAAASGAIVALLTRTDTFPDPPSQRIRRTFFSRPYSGLEVDTASVVHLGRGNVSVRVSSATIAPGAAAVCAPYQKHATIARTSAGMLAPQTPKTRARGRGRELRFSRPRSRRGSSGRRSPAKTARRRSGN